MNILYSLGILCFYVTFVINLTNMTIVNLLVLVTVLINIYFNEIILKFEKVIEIIDLNLY